MKTTREIINDELGVILNSVDYDVNNALFEINKNKKWFSEEEIKKAIFKSAVFNKWENMIAEDKLLNELFGDGEQK
jgi:hypothetical protein